MSAIKSTLKYQLEEHSNKVSVAIIGAGGIGSHFCRILHKLIVGKQILKCSYGYQNFLESIDVYDFDAVSDSNLLHQDFQPNEVFAPKCIIMGVRYGFNPKCERFTDEHLEDYNLFIICADNPGVRAMVYRHVDDHNNVQKNTLKKYFVDMRSEGDMVAVFTDKAPLPTLLESLGNDDQTRDSIVGRSCQLVTDTAKGQIQPGNFLVPVLGAHVLLKMARGENYPANIIQSVV